MCMRRTLHVRREMRVELAFRDAPTFRTGFPRCVANPEVADAYRSAYPHKREPWNYPAY